MALPDRPVAHVNIESDWGQQIHDYTFAPAGCETEGGYRTQSSSLAILAVDTGTVDPGGYMDAANDRIVVPTNGAGLYSIEAVSQTDTGATGTSVQLLLYLNGTAIRSGIVGCSTGIVTIINLGAHLSLTAGDVITCFGRQIGADPHPRMSLRLSLVRLGADYGAP